MRVVMVVAGMAVSVFQHFLESFMDAILYLRVGKFEVFEVIRGCARVQISGQLGAKRILAGAGFEPTTHERHTSQETSRKAKKWGMGWVKRTGELSAASPFTQSERRKWREHVATADEASCS
jgi:hypothetical protein